MAAQKVYDFILVFKSKGHAMVNWISRIMLLLAVAVFIFASLPFTKVSVSPLAITAIVITWWLLTEVRLRKGKPVFFRIALLVAGVGWYIQPGGFYLAMIYVAAALIEKQVKFPQEVAFDEEEIVLNTFPRKRYGWTAVNNIVLKDGILTIDFTTNKFIQKELESFPSVKDEQEFNTFCRQRLQGISTAASSTRDPAGI